MKPQRLLQYFDRIAEAPDAVSRLRRFILDLAVRGKLVEQDPKDEPASELLKRIRAEKARLAKEGKGRKDKPSVPLLDDDLPFSIPAGWQWSQLATIGFISPRNYAGGALLASFVPMTLIPAEYGSSHSHEVRPWYEIKSGYTHFAEGDVGLAKITPCFENGKSTVFRGLTAGIGAGTTELHIVRPLLVNADYVLLFLKCPHFIETGIPRMTGTAGQKRVSAEYFAYSPFPLPPLAEQHRIVAKVDELMALCDRLEAAQAKRESRRDRLAASSLHRLNNGADAESFCEHARFHLRHLPLLSTRPEHIKQLRRTILNLAIRGRLVPQDPNDEPAAELLKRIQAEKARLVRDGKMRPQEFAAPVEDDEVPFNVPKYWKWVRLGGVLSSSFYGPRFGAEEYSEQGIPTIRTTDMTLDGHIVLRDPPKVQVPDDRLDDFKCVKDDLLVTRTGSIGTMAVFTGNYAAIPSAYLIRLRFTAETRVNYLYMVLRSPYGQEALGLNITKVAQPNINAKNLSAIAVPLPPLAEQHRIVAKVDELMALCDGLEAQLTTATTECRRLLDGILDNAIAAESQPS